MEWVEVSAKTLEAAKEAALEQLGVSEGDAEVVVVSEPKSGLFGRVRGEARVRARVRPVGPRPKRVRRTREQSRGSGGGGRSGGQGRSGGSRGGQRPEGGAGGGRGGSGGSRRDSEGAEARSDGQGRGAGAAGGGNGSGTGGGSTGDGGSGTGAGGGGQSRSARRRRNRARQRTEGPGERANGTAGAAAAGARRAGTGDGARRDGRNGSSKGTTAKEDGEMAEGMTLEEQATVAREFLEGLLDELGLEASVETRVLDDETVELAATGEGLGVLVGPKGSTLAALQDVTRTVVQRNFDTRTDRILVDVAGYREKRAAALQRFSESVAAEVIETGTERAMEPMSPADRKIVHDAVNGIEGVQTRSEGEDPHRYIVISPAD